MWRLAAAGWTVRYEPSVVVEHPARGPSARVARPARRLRIVGGAAGAAPSGRDAPPRDPALGGRPVAARRRRPAAGGAARRGRRHGLCRGATAAGSRRPAAAARVRRARSAAHRTAGAGCRLAGVSTARRRRRRSPARGRGDRSPRGWRSRSPPTGSRGVRGSIRSASARCAPPTTCPMRPGVWLGCVRARTASPLVPKLVSGPGGRR